MASLNTEYPQLVVVPFFTVATVLKQGSRQSETVTPENRWPEQNIRMETKIFHSVLLKSFAYDS